MEGYAQDMETTISCAMRARIRDFNDQGHSLTLAKVRRSLEKDMGLKKFTLDAHKRFIKQCLHECFSELDDENLSKNMGKNSELVVHSEETERDKSEKIPSEETIKKAIKKRASYFRDNSETITLSGARRLLEEDLKLEKNALDAYKSFISKQLDEVLQSPEVVESMNGFKKKGPKKASDSNVRGGSSKGSGRVSRRDGSSDSSDISSSGEEGAEEQRVKQKKQAVKKVAARNIERQKKRKRSTKERKPSCNEKNNPVKSAAEKGSDTDEGGNSSEDGKSQSSAEEPVKKKREISTQVHGKRVEHLKSIIKACRLSIPPPVYKRAKQAPENKREAHFIKELEEILGKEGLSSNPSEKEIKEVRKQKERAKQGIDMSNIVSSSRRRSTSNFIIPPPKPRLAVEKNDGGGRDDEEDTDDEESESEGASEEIKEVKKQKERAKQGIDMSNIVSSSRRRSTSNFIIPPPKPRLAVEKNDGGDGGGRDDEEVTDDEESESEGTSEEIKHVKKQKKRAKLGIDMSNIVSSSRRRSTSNFIIPPPKPRLAVEINDGGGGGDEEDTDDEESESEGASEEIKHVKKQKKRAKLGIDMSNIVSSSRRRSTSNFIIPPPQPRLAVEKNDGGAAGGGDEEDTDDEGSESEGASEEIKDVKKQKKRAKLGIDMSNIVSSSRRRSTSNFIIPPPKPRLVVEKNGGVGGSGGDDDDEEDTDDEESESEGACEGLMLHAGASSTSAQQSNTRELVEFNQVGQLVGENAASFSTFLGQLTREHCPIRYADWRSIPGAVKDKLWSMIRGVYEVDEKHKEKVLQKMNLSLRKWKCQLRKHFDKFDQVAERKRNCPKGVTQEEWDSFVDVESTEQSISRREKGKASRKEMKGPHTTGRRGAARTAEKMRKENPDTIITRTDLYMATHTRSDGSYPTQKLSVTMERIKSIIANDPASKQRDLDHDPVAQVCGRDSKGLVRGLGGGVSKTTIMASTPFMEEAQTERSARMSLASKTEATMTEMLKRLDEEKAFRMSLEQQLADIRQQIACQGQHVHCCPERTASQAYHQSGDASSLQDDSTPSPRTVQICRFLVGD
ncbi:uncharacterized protein LOC131258224 isoform X1 [Magnolia sinica]|uniref:uncharacterized protein LOC131258224 isoform X1 n=1 Tax=Magnolia sinica TaxID=86752 RepID=UPI002657AE79|nr:uncharacterized protein LOC131258224 isoform X1 [Magnolia sinica]